MFCISKYFKKSWHSIFNMKNQQEMIKYIEKNVINLNPNEILEFPINCFTPLMYTCYYKLDLVAIKILEIYSNKCNIHHEDGHKKTIFYYAIRNNLNNVTEKMIDIYGYDIINFNNFNEYIYMFMILVKKYGNKCNIDNLDSNNNTILMWACDKLLSEFAIYLIETFGIKCNIEQVNKDNKNALNIAINNRLYDVIKKILTSFTIVKILGHNYNNNINTIVYLIDNYSNFFDIGVLDINNNTILMWACIKKQDNIAIKLIDKYGYKCNIEKVNKDSKNALDIAIIYNLENVAIKLIDTFGEKCILNINNMSDNSPIYLAINNKLEKVAIKLLYFYYKKQYIL